MMLRVHRIVERTKAEGPGQRFCIWVQGCNHGCTGCFAQDTWDNAQGMLYNESDITKLITRNATEIEGITLLGGEPFDQTKALAPIVETAKMLGLSVMAFTGYMYEYLIELNDPHLTRLLKATDLLIDGPYIERLRDFSRPWVGSSNQRFIFLSDRYNENIIYHCSNQFEIRVDSRGRILVNGMGDQERLRQVIGLMPAE